ncbi:MAG: AraC family transcriptional regulator [Ndongobacter sp.]|nr:AraC family transcriptional regulator [Ndongobacter sp.]
MQMIKAFNETIRYIESELEGGIDEKRVVSLSGYSYAMFSRLFSILTGMTLSEYIRLRKLTKAAVELHETNARVIDIAIKYGYESPDSFANAFKSFHCATPTEVRSGEAYRVVSPIQLTLSVKGGKNMDVKIQKKSGFAVAGVKADNIASSSCPEVWSRLYENADHDALSRLGNGQYYGMCYDVENENEINYMACYHVEDIPRARSMGLEVVEIEEAEYAILSLKGAVPDCIHEGWKYAMEVFLPEQGYMHAGTPDFEVYFDGDMYRPEYEMELWIPLKKKE